MKTAHSLRYRLLLGGAVWIALALTVSWLFIVATFTGIIQAERRADLQVSLDRLVSQIDPASEALVPEGSFTDPRYETPLGGIYWQVRDLDQGKLVRSRSMWDIELPAVATPGPPVLSEFRRDGAGPIIALTQTIRIPQPNGTERHFSVTVAEERAGTESPYASFGASLTSFLIILALALFAAAALQVHFGLRPLSVLHRQIGAVRTGAAARLGPGSSVEIQPLVEQVNDLLDAQEASMDFTRERASDLAHGLKTPLAVLNAMADRLRQKGDTENAPILAMLVEQMNERIDYQLRISRLRYRTRAQGVTSSLNDTVLRSVAVLRKATNFENLGWVVDLDSNLDVNMDKHDLLELVGILLENAQQWAGRQVLVRGRRVGETIELSVEDDGQGLSDDQIARIGTRGVRLDESGSGDGLGLAIAFEIVRLNRAQLILSRGTLGGLSANVQFPATSAAASG